MPLLSIVNSRMRLSCIEPRIFNTVSPRFISPNISTYLRRIIESVIFHRINRELPILFAELDQSLREADDVLEVDVLIYHSVRHH